MKKWTVLTAVLLLVATVLSACGGGNNNGGNNAAGNTTGNAAANNEAAAGNSDTEAKKRVALVTPEKIGVNQFFTQMVEGLDKAAGEFNLETKVIESADPTQVEQNLRAAVAEKYDLIITAAYTAADALTKVAAENPDQAFAIIDTVVDAPNIRSIEFREYEAAYLLGAAAGLSTKTGTVGAIVAMDAPLLSKYTSGFDQGLKSVKPDATFLINYVGSFTDPAKAKELALLQNQKGADFIAGMAAVGDSGVFEAAKEKGFYTAGQDTDRTGEDPEHVVLSQLKETDTVTYETAKDFAAGNFTYGSISYGLKENGVGVTFVTAESTSPLSAFIGQENVDKLKKIRDDIVSGAIVVTNPLAQ
ncbi:basic membrane protein A [Paenibacillus phyllosphaerae]|uniref:Basic membrane protein A n=1 Tax=Paenibacillus phyllosphaerae TaxID=274593 RepID=A0A7W5B4G7_9BACL|nr:BMP family protein [Paenibacillus phyllosphaerae]MBB3113526.1 basic membrane protein A [Paenibacillus phyllosphaerae]